MQTVGSFGASKMSITQYLVGDGSTVKIENTKIKKKMCPAMFKSISNHSSVTTLIIRSCRLKKLPIEIALLVNLRVLKIEDNLLTEVPPIDTLVELTEASFSYNQIKLFPASLVKLEKLTSLDLSHNPITCIPGAVSQITALVNLHLDHTPLPYFPVSICALPKIEELTCAGNKWGAFPEQILQFSELRCLNLGSNNIPSVHPDIGKLTKLTYLDLSDNTISSLPKELCNLTQLTTLLLQHNKLYQLPMEIGKLTALESLKLHDNQLTVLPESIGDLSALVELYLQENEFASLPNQLGDCTALRTLRLAYNKLSTLPDSLSNMGKLNVLMLHDNQMSEIPKVLSRPTFLKHLLRVTLHNNLFSEAFQNDITVMGALHFLQEMYAETSPPTLRKQHRERSMRRNTSRGHITRSHNRVPGLKSSTGSTGSNGSESNDSSPDDGERPKLSKEPSLTSKLKVQARRRAISVGEVIPPALDSDSDSDTDFRPWKSQMEFRTRSGSVPNGTSPIPPYRAFQRVYEYLVDQLDLSEKRKDSVNSLPHEEKWRLLSNLSRESSLNLLVNTKPRSAPGSPTIVASPTRPTAAGPNFSAMLTVSPSSPSLSLGSPLKSPRAPVFLSSTLRSPSTNSLPQFRSSTDNIRTTREMLTSQSVAWITTFAETGGIESILQGLNAVSLKKNKSEDDYYTILEYLSCITIMIGIGLESLLISNAVEILVLNVDSDNISVKEATISVLDEVCNVFYSGQGLVIDALTKKSLSPADAFLPMCKALRDPHAPMGMKAGSMKLINNLITNTDELEARCQIRNSFIKLGLQETINKIRESSGDEYQRLEQQIDHFEEVMNDDGEEIAIRFKQGHVDGKELLLSSFGLEAKIARDSQQVPMRVVLPSVSHTHMSCMVAQHPCDATTTTRELIAAILKEYGKGMGADTEKGAYGLYVVNGSKATPAPGEKLDATGGFFLDENRYVLPLAIDNVILDMRLRPWIVTILIDKSINDLVAPPTPKSSGGVKPLPTVPEIQIEAEPKSTCGALLLQVLRRFYGDRGCEVEELAFFMEKEKKPTDKTGKASPSGGVWLESTARLADYGHEVTKTKLQLKKMPKILKIILADESFEYVGYDEDTVIRSVLLDTFQRLIAPSLNRGNAPSPSHYGLYYYNADEPDIGEWLDPEKTLRSYYLPNRAPLRYQLRPKSLNIQHKPPPNFQGTLPKITSPAKVNFYAPIGGVLDKLGIPLEGSAIYLVNESTGNQYLDPSLSLFNQNVPENSTIIIQPATKELQAASVNIWDEPENAATIMYNVDNFNEIHAATINKLVERLTSEKDHDPDFTQVFESTYRSFMTHETLFAKLVERYIPPEHVPETPALNLVRLRVIVFLKNWIEHCGPDFPMNVMLSIEKFIDNQLCKGGHMNLAAQLKKMIQAWKAQNLTEVPLEKPDLSYQMSNPTKIIHGFSSLVDEWGLALALTIREAKLFSHIMPVEFFKQKGNEVNVAHMINNFNRVAAWVPIAILSEIKLVHRANALERFIKLAWNLRQLHNFHLLTAVLSGLSNSAVLRLKWTFAKVAKRYKQMHEELEAIMGMEGSFKVYRQTLVEATPPCVPYIGVYLTDLVFIEDGNPDKVGNMVNWTKRRYMYNIISTFQRYQLTPYDEKLQSPSSPTHASGTTPRVSVSENKEANINTFLTFLNRMPILSDKQLYDMSMAREPRNADRRELM